MMTLTDKQQLEHLIDYHGLRTVLDWMVEICHGKADHLRDNWQDIPASVRWQRTGQLIERLAASTRIGAVDLLRPDNLTGDSR